MANADGLREKVRERYRQLAADTVAEMVSDLRSSAPYDTGETSSSIYSEPTSLEPVIGYRLVSPTPQGEWVEDGTAAHIIVPVNAKALHFFISGAEVFTKKVHHPGMPPRPWFRPILEQWSDRLASNLN